jgi:hypothetical protein
MIAPSAGDAADFLKTVEDFAVEQLIAQAGIGPKASKAQPLDMALNAETGQLRWTFQTTHHDLWDYDVGSQPVLIEMRGTPALVQPTKRGQIFVLDRRTGRPLLPIVERKVPTDGAPGERLASTQPFSPALPDFAGPRPTEARMWGLTPFDQLICRIMFRAARFDGTLTPIGLDRPTITWPGYIGGIDWGSVAIDPTRRIMVVNNNQISNYNRLLRRDEANRRGLRPITPEHEKLCRRGSAAARDALCRRRYALPLPHRPAVPATAVGPGQRRRPENRQDRLEPSTRDVARQRTVRDCDQAAYPHGYAQSRRSGRHCRGRDLHRRGEGTDHPRI